MSHPLWDIHSDCVAHTHMECAVEYDGLCHQWVRRWAKSPIRDEQVLLHLSHGQTVLVVLMTCCLRAALFLSSSANHNSSNDAVANRHVVRHCARSNAAVLSDWGPKSHTRTHNHFRTFVWDYAGGPVPEETFTHSRICDCAVNKRLQSFKYACGGVNMTCQQT